MVSIDLNYNNAYKWTKKDKIYSIGYIFYNNKFYQGNQINELLEGININEISDFIKKIDGCFSIVINNESEIIIISDLLRNFPVFYSIQDNKIMIKDNIMEYDKKILDNDSITELSYTNYVTGYNTLFKNIFQLEAHQVVRINNKTIILREINILSINTILHLKMMMY